MRRWNLLRCWGEGRFGHLGNGLESASPLPVVVCGSGIGPGCGGDVFDRAAWRRCGVLEVAP